MIFCGGLLIRFKLIICFYVSGCFCDSGPVKHGSKCDYVYFYTQFIEFFDHEFVSITIVKFILNFSEVLSDIARYTLFD